MDKLIAVLHVQGDDGFAVAACEEGVVREFLVPELLVVPDLAIDGEDDSERVVMQRLRSLQWIYDRESLVSQDVDAVPRLLDSDACVRNDYQQKSRRLSVSSDSFSSFLSPEHIFFNHHTLTAQACFHFLAPPIAGLRGRKAVSSLAAYADERNWGWTSV